MSIETRDGELEDLLEFLRGSRGFDFTGYKRPSLVRRIAKRMQAAGVDGFGEYRRHLEAHPEEFAELLNHLLINVTGFFRDPPTWDVLAEEVIPRIVDGTPASDPIRVWCAGVATGEEAYSVAILLAEHLGEETFRSRVKVYGTDRDEEALVAARAGAYGRKDVEVVPPVLVDRYFDRRENRFVVTPRIRRQVVYGRHDLVLDPPISRVDLLVCRNTVMYFTAETQRRVLGHFRFAVREGGFLILGKAEMLFTQLPWFAPLDLKRRVFVRVAEGGSLREWLVIAAERDEGTVARLANHARGREAAFEAGPVAQLLVDRSGYLVQANWQARELFGIASSDVGRPLRDLEISYRPVDLRSRIDDATRDREPVTITDVSWSPMGSADVMDLVVDVAPLVASGGTLLGVSIVFRDVTAYRVLQRELETSNQELETAMEELQSTNEELETTNEELQSTNEELETTNEELQSTNEELETMNEELQSTNEELQTVNEELRERSTELNEANIFLGSILSSIEAGVVVVDRDLRVQMWNARSEDLWGLRADEVRGRPFLGLDIGLPVAAIRDDLLASLANGAGRREARVSARDRRGKDVDLVVTATPLLGPGEDVLGVIVVAEEGVPR